MVEHCEREDIIDNTMIKKAVGKTIKSTKLLKDITIIRRSSNVQKKQDQDLHKQDNNDQEQYYRDYPDESIALNMEKMLYAISGRKQRLKSTPEAGERHE